MATLAIGSGFPLSKYVILADAYGRLSVSRIGGLSVMSTLPHESANIQFEAQQAGDEWVVVAFCPGAKPQHIPGFKTESEAQQWIATKRPSGWRRSFGA